MTALYYLKRGDKMLDPLIIGNRASAKDFDASVKERKIGAPMWDDVTDAATRLKITVTQWLVFVKSIQYLIMMLLQIAV